MTASARYRIAVTRAQTRCSLAGWEALASQALHSNWCISSPFTTSILTSHIGT